MVHAKHESEALPGNAQSLARATDPAYEPTAANPLRASAGPTEVGQRVFLARTAWVAGALIFLTSCATVGVEHQRLVSKSNMQFSEKNQTLQYELTKQRAQASGLERICENYKLQLQAK